MKSNSASRFNLIGRSSPRAQKYFAFVFPEIVLQSGRSVPMERGASRSSRTWCGMRWTRMCLLTSGMDADGKGVWSWRPKGWR
jgi:hypothetical protein